MPILRSIQYNSDSVITLVRPNWTKVKRKCCCSALHKYIDMINHEEIAGVFILSSKNQANKKNILLIWRWLWRVDWCYMKFNVNVENLLGALSVKRIIEVAQMRSAGNQRVTVCAIHAHKPHARHLAAARFNSATFKNDDHGLLSAISK